MAIDSPIVIVSDIHLQDAGDEKSRLLLEVIEKIDPATVEYFVLLGDIFDFCLGSSSYFRRKFGYLGESLSRLADKGVKVVFVEGNHEFDLAALQWPNVKFITDQYHTITLKSGLKIGLCHGDLLAPDSKYLTFRSFVKSKFMTDLSSYVPGMLLDFYALNHARISRNRTRNMELCHDRVVKGVMEWSEKHDVDFYIFGHFHIPYAEKIPNGKKMLSVNSWDKPNILAVSKEGSAQRCYLSLTENSYRFESIFGDTRGCPLF